MAKSPRKRSQRRSSTKRHKHSSETQSILINRNIYTLAQAKAWIKKHGFHCKKVDINTK